MLRPSLTSTAVALLCASAMAQGDLSSRPQPITAPFKHAGVYHVATGTWTRNSSQSILGPDIIYNNSCTTGYFNPTQSGELLQHRSVIPTTAANGAPTQDSVFYPGSNPPHEFDEQVGCDTKYIIQHFEIAYCSSIVFTGSNSVNWFFKFADSYTLCGSDDMITNVFCDYLVTGLPVGTPTGGQICWVVDIDLSAVTPECSLLAHGDGTFVGPTGNEQFGYSQGPASAGISLAMDTGPVVAGNYTWTGGTLVGVLAPCTGADGTIWDSPINLAEEGTGMASSDFFRITGPTPSVAPGCYFFGGQPHSDFYLKIYSKTCPEPGPMQPFCVPGAVETFGTVISCPCSNPPAGGGLGCNNFGAGPAQSGTLSATGVADLSDDTGTPSLFLQITGMNNTSTNVIWTGTGEDTTVPIGVAHGAGVRCVTTNLKRLYTRSGAQVSGGATSAPTGADLSVSDRSAAIGAAISPGQTRYYFDIYRDPAAAGPCGNTSSTVNLTNAGRITWVP